MHINRMIELISESLMENRCILDKFPGVDYIQKGDKIHYYIPEELRDKVIELVRELTNIEINEVETKPVEREEIIYG